MKAMGIEFNKAFEALTGKAPLRWQRRFFDRLYSGKIPPVCDLPTGLGKTSIIPIWMIALSRQAAGDKITLPRRLAYIVNRRTVVDQSTTLVEQIRERLLKPSKSDWSAHEEVLCSLASALRCLSPKSQDNIPLAVSTLRGELADNEEWKSDPSRAAIVIGTIDMIGSKLLFSGYGDGLYKSVHHAGLIGQDVFIVHDEAHLTPAFSNLLRRVEDAQKKDCETRPIQLMELSATQHGFSGNSDVLSLEKEDEQDKFVVDRLDAKKPLYLHRLDPKKQADKRFVQKIVELAYRHEDAMAKVLIYVRQPDTAQRIATKLQSKLKGNANDRVALLTGTIRGHERDQLVIEDQVYRKLLNAESHPQKTVYLVSTSAGEVGIDIDADHMVCDLTTLDSMIQRLGRVNRRGGEDRKASVDVVWMEKDEKPGNNANAANALTILKRWKCPSCGTINASPRNLRKIVDELSEDEQIGAFSPMPAIRPLTDILLDAWSLTSIRKMPGRPEVAAYLHGLTCDPPETYVVWRQEIALFGKHEIDDRSLRQWFNKCGIRAGERLRYSTDRLKEKFSSLLREHRRQEIDRDFPVVLLNARGEAELSCLSRVVEDWEDFDLKYKTVFLPVEAGGLGKNGMIDPKMVDPNPDHETDIAEKGKPQRERWLCAGTKENPSYRRLLSEESLESLPQRLQERIRVPLKEPDESAENSEEITDLLLCMPQKQSTLGDPETANVRQTLTEHTEAIIKHMSGISDRLSLEPSIKTALVSAAKWHDRGKDRAVWQRYARNNNGAETLAKSTKYLHWRALGGYRHEFGSLLEAMDSECLRDCSERDLILHLIAAHHGHARPHFEPKAFDHECFTTRNNEDAATEVMRRFGRLQHRFGRWGLAWLESLLRCADIAASQATGETKQRHIAPED